MVSAGNQERSCGVLGTIDGYWWPCRVQQVYDYPEAVVKKWGIDHARFENLGSQRVLATFEGSSQVDTARPLPTSTLHTHTCTHARIQSPMRTGSMSCALAKWPGP